MYLENQLVHRNKIIRDLREKIGGILEELEA